MIAGLRPGNDSYALIPLDQPARPAQLIATSPPHRAAPRGPPPGDPALPASKQTRRFSGWLLGCYLPLT
jgi:hypothetical protein